MAELAKIKLVCSTHECKDCPFWECCPKEGVPADWNVDLMVEKLKRVCPMCGAPKEPDESHCRPCRTKVLARTKKRYMAEHRCKDCGKPLPEGWAHKRCEGCLEKVRQKSKRREMRGAFDNA